MRGISKCSGCPPPLLRENCGRPGHMPRPMPGSRGPRGPTRKGPREGFRVVSIQPTQPRPYKKREGWRSSGTPTLDDADDLADLAKKIAGGAY